MLALGCSRVGSARADNLLWFHRVHRRGRTRHELCRWEQIGDEASSQVELEIGSAMVRLALEHAAMARWRRQGGIEKRDVMCSGRARGRGDVI